MLKYCISIIVITTNMICYVSTPKRGIQQCYMITCYFRQCKIVLYNVIVQLLYHNDHL